LASAALVLGGVVSGGGLSAVALKVLRLKKTEETDDANKAIEKEK
jgi:hypothetical protein